MTATSSTIADLWACCGPTPEPYRLGVLSDAYFDQGDDAAQLFLRWAMKAGYWPQEYRRQTDRVRSRFVLYELHVDERVEVERHESETVVELTPPAYRWRYIREQSARAWDAPPKRHEIIIPSVRCGRGFRPDHVPWYGWSGGGKTIRKAFEILFAYWSKLGERTKSQLLRMEFGWSAT